MANNIKQLAITDDVLSLITNMEYYNKKIDILLRQQVDRDFDDNTKESLSDNKLDIRLACMTACISTVEWIDNCIANYRALITKANEITDSNKLKINMEDNNESAIVSDKVTTSSPASEQSTF